MKFQYLVSFKLCLFSLIGIGLGMIPVENIHNSLNHLGQKNKEIRNYSSKIGYSAFNFLYVKDEFFNSVSQNFTAISSSVFSLCRTFSNASFKLWHE